MRYFRAFYASEESTSRMDSLQPIHVEFDDRVYVLPYHRNGFSDELPERFCATLIAKDGDVGKAAAQKYFRRAIQVWGIGGMTQTRIEECTIEGCFMNDVYRFSTGSFDESQVKRQLNLGNTYSFVSRSSTGLREHIVSKPLSRDAAMRLAADTKYGSSLMLELGHIFSGGSSVCVSPDAAPANPDGEESNAMKDDLAKRGATFAPIAYIVEGNAPSDSDDAMNILIGAMLDAGRVDSGHVFTIDIDNYMRWPLRDSDADKETYINHQLIRAIEGNVLVIRYGAFESNGNYDMYAYALFARLLDLIETAGCQTQVMFAVPEGKKDVVMRLRKRYNKPFVLIGKDTGTDVGSASYERNLAKMELMASERGIEPDESMGVLLSKRMRGKRKTELEGIFEEWVTYHDARLAFPQYANAIDEAINLGGTEAEPSALERLDALVGLEGVKEHIRNIILRAEMGQKMMERGIPLEPFCMNMAFLGAPGTGKTEVARLYAEILKDMGILSEGRVITVSGGSAFDVQRTFEKAQGSVLFVDEAYGMLNSVTSITEFIAQMENNRGDTVVILAGYEGHIKRLLGSNPGFRSRVQTMIKFSDYTADELREIFAFMCEKAGMRMEPGVSEAIRDLLERGGKRSDQGNARFVRRVFEDAVGAQQVRLAKQMAKDPDAELELDDLRTLALEDVEKAARELGVVRKGPAVSAREELAELIGLSDVKELVSARMDFAKLQKVKRDAGLDAPYIPMHMAFKGNPGTGKTEVARLIGRILREEGVLSVGDFFECGRQDLVSPAVGGSAPMVEALFEEARGSVIFIDEAYSLIDAEKGGPGDEAINALIDQMEKMREEVVVILAGYTTEIDDLLSTNPGFKSRVKVQVEFPDYSADELVSILRHMAERQGYVLGDGVDEKVFGFAEKAMRDSTFGNARFVRNLLEDALVRQSVRLASKADESESLSVEELTLVLPEDFAWEGPKRPHSVGFAA